MTVPKNTYVGRRYIPKLFQNPNDNSATWINTVSHESLTIVMWQGASYTSKQDVPIGIDISDTRYWTRSADYNAQISIYEQNVRDYHQYVIDQIGIINDDNETFKTQQLNDFNTYKNTLQSDFNDYSDTLNTSFDNYKEDVNNQISIFDDKTKSFLNIISTNIDDTLLLQTIINTLDNIVFPYKQTFYIKSTIKIPSNKYIDFNHCIFIPVTGGTFINNYMFLVNSNDGIDWIDRFQGFTNTLNNLQINNNNNILDVKGIFLGCSADIYNYKSYSMYGDITICDRYIDGIQINRVFINNHQGNFYSIAQLNDESTLLKNASGDSWHISNLQTEGGNRKLLYLCGTNSNVTIDGVINGYVYLKNGSFVLKNFHIEVGNLTIQNAKVEYSNSISYFDTPNNPPITVLTDNGSSKPIVFKNIHFSYPYWSDGIVLTMGTYYPAIRFDPLFNSNVKIENCTQGMEGKNELQGIFINKTDGNDITCFEGSTMSNISIFNTKRVLFPTMYEKNSPTSNNFINIAYNQIATYYSSQNDDKRGILWKGNSGTYYYKIGILLDYDRRIGVYDPREFNFAINNIDRKLIDISILDGYVANINNANLVIYRGTSTGNYNYRSIVGMVDTSSHQYDDYNSIGLRPWQSITAGGVMALNNYTKVVKNNSDGLVTCYGTATPTAGSWQVGDRIINTNIAVGQVKSWICSVAGSQGTWIAEGTY